MPFGTFWCAWPAQQTTAGVSLQSIKAAAVVGENYDRGLVVRGGKVRLLITLSGRQKPVIRYPSVRFSVARTRSSFGGSVAGAGVDPFCGRKYKKSRSKHHCTEQCSRHEERRFFLRGAPTHNEGYRNSQLLEPSQPPTLNADIPNQPKSKKNL